MRRLLIVDDESVAAEGLRSLLEQDGYDVVALTSGRLATGRLAQEGFDAVLTDLEMPGVHGLEVVRAARARQPPVPVVTGYYGTPASDAALAAGARQIVPKPIDYDGLLRALSGLDEETN
jgi:CheY-like chemotaxis protein